MKATPKVGSLLGGRMTAAKRPFPLGQTVATPGALAALEKDGEQPATFLDRHVRNDWGNVCHDDWKANDEALELGERVLSSYMLKDGTKIWIITEADRSATTILLPEEY